MPQMSDPRDLFLHELGDLLYVEKTLVKTLPKLAGEATDEKLRAGFEKHLDETRRHVANLEEVFELLDEPAKAERCLGIDGITQEHDEFMREESPSPDVCDLFLAGAGARAEHYEIASYTGLVTMAKALGERECATLLEKNLKQEEAALRKLETASKRLAKQPAAA
jgi:ferritin-like metal-binding protein YciE